MKQRRDKIPIDEQQLRKMYLEQLMTTTEIAATLFVSTKTARNMLNEIGIMRTAMETRILRQKQQKCKTYVAETLGINDDEIRAAIVNALNSTPNTFATAEKLGISVSSLYTNMKRLGIKKEVVVTWK